MISNSCERTIADFTENSNTKIALLCYFSTGYSFQMDTNYESAYAEMAKDKKREKEPLEWAEMNLQGHGSRR
jgi:hypothetical protein